MAVHDFSISDAEYNQMMAVFGAVRTKLAGARDVLTVMCNSEPAKVRAFVDSENGRWLREIFKMRNDLNNYISHIGLEK